MHMNTNIIVLLIFHSILSSALFAQDDSLTIGIVERHYNDKQLVQEMQYDRAGNLYVLSSTDNNRMKLGQGVFCYYLTKYNREGKQVVQKRFGAAPHGGATLGITAKGLPFVTYGVMYYHFFALFSEQCDILLSLGSYEERPFIVNTDKGGNLVLLNDGRIATLTQLSSDGAIVRTINGKERFTVQFSKAAIQPVNDDKLLVCGLNHENKAEYYTFDYSTGIKSEYKEIDPQEYSEVVIQGVRIPKTTVLKRPNDLIVYIPEEEQKDNLKTYVIRFDMSGEPIKRNNTKTNVWTATNLGNRSGLVNGKLGATVSENGYPASGLFLFSIDSTGNLMLKTLGVKQTVNVQ